MPRLRIFWDLDCTLLDVATLLEECLDDLAITVGKSHAEIETALAWCDAQTFTWELLFERVGLPRESWPLKKARYTGHVAFHAAEWLYPGVVEIVRDYAEVAEHVLVTAGDAQWQRLKWDAVKSAFGGAFLQSNEHFVALNGSKGMRIASYRDGLLAVFVEDSAARLREAKQVNPGLIGIRMAWEIGEPNEGDGLEWEVARNAEQLRDVLQNIVNRKVEVRS